MRDMACQGPCFSALLLNAIFFTASKHVGSKDELGFSNSCSDTDKCDAGVPFRQKIEGILYHRESRALCRSEIPTIQALLLLSDVLFSWCDERSLSWHYLGIAINMIVDLGIHSNNSALMLDKAHMPETMEIQRRVFWAAFGKPCHIVSSFMHHRPLIMPGSDGQDTINLSRPPGSSAGD